MSQQTDRNTPRTVIDPQATIGSIALAEPTTITVFERLKLDYCCGGSRPLAEACAEKHLALHEVLAQLEAAPLAGASQLRDLTAEPLAEVITVIVNTHHAYVRNQLPQLLTMAAKVVARHGAAHPEVAGLESMVQALAEDLTQHLAKEELILFPYIQKLEQSLANGGELPHACFATVASPIAAMENEHDLAGHLLERMRATTNGYTLPADACTTFIGLYAGLQAFEQDLHLHIHRENNLLFPRAIELEKKIRVAA